MKSILTWLFTLFIIGFGPVAAAETTTSQVTSNSYEDSFPRIAGDYLVWQGQADGDWEVFLYHIATGQTTRLTDNDHDDLCPQTDGRYVVWQGFRDGEWDVFLWEAGGEAQAVSERGAEDTSPRIANGFVVWTSDPFGEDFVGPSEVFLYEPSSQTTTVLSAQVDPDNSLDDGGARINGEAVLWTQSGDSSGTTLYMYSLTDGTITANPEDPWKESPQRDGGLSVLTKRIGGDREIILVNGAFMRHHQITDNAVEDRGPCISGNRVAWMAGGEIFLAECKYLGLIRPEDGAELPRKPAPTFVWEGIGYEAFTLEFSTDAEFPARKTLTLPRFGLDWLSETSFTPTSREWRFIRWMERRHGHLYWRVKGKDSNGEVSFSEAWSFSIESIRNKESGSSLQRTPRRRR